MRHAQANDGPATETIAYPLAGSTWSKRAERSVAQQGAVRTDCGIGGEGRPMVQPSCANAAGLACRA
jgi:hypothetical protein